MDKKEQIQRVALNPDKKQAVLALDIGGTEIGWGVFPVSGGNILEHPVSSGKVSTQKGLENLKETFQDVVLEAASTASQRGYSVDAIGSVAPGRYIGEHHDTIAPGSARNMGITPDEFDGVNLRQEFASMLPDNLNIWLSNDAIAQAQGILHTLLAGEDRETLLGKKGAYIGPGSGLGGAFFEVDKGGNITMFTDGHIFDVMVNVDGKEYMIEDILSGKGLEKLSGGISTRQMDEDASIRSQHQHLIKLSGKGLAALVKCIHAGDFHKATDEAQWPQSDLHLVQGTNLFIIGGSVGTSENIGPAVLNHAKEILSQNGLFPTFLTGEGQGKEVATKAATAIIPLSALPERGQNTSRTPG